MSDHARVLFFATLREKTGTHETSLEFPQGTNIAAIKKAVLEKYPGLQPIMGSVIVAMNHEFAFDEDIVEDGAEIAMFPPVSGGERNTFKFPTIIGIVEDEIDINKIISEITLPVTGGVCIFTGTVRRQTRREVRHETEHLVYEAYSGMAELKIGQICDEIRSRWKDVQGIAIVQRTGKLMPGNISVVVACSSAHRDEGIFEATRYGIDRLKEIVPVWKKEVSPEGEVWVEGKYHPHKGE
jgi:molybdopterin converting factor subunit 1